MHTTHTHTHTTASHTHTHTHSCPQAEAEAALEEAIPALEEAAAALKDLRKDDITEIRSFAKPPDLVQKVGTYGLGWPEGGDRWPRMILNGLEWP